MLSILRQKSGENIYWAMRGIFLLCITAAFVFCANAILATTTAQHPVRLRVNTSHALENARGAVLDAGLDPVADVIVTPSSLLDGGHYLTPEKLIADGLTAGASILSSSFSGWDYRFDSMVYLKQANLGMTHVYAYEPRSAQPAGVPPPASFVTVNKVGGKTGDGIEFGVLPAYMRGKGQSTSPSGVTAQLAGLMACLKFQHPDWNWFDVKAALRNTASNFPSGYNAQKFGYGVIDYPAANALRDAKALPLFPPAAVVRARQGNRIVFAVNSFRQSRRQADVLFKFRMRPIVQPKELRHDDLVNMGGQQLFSGDTSTTTNTLSLQIQETEMAYFVWLSRDAHGFYSRIEPYSVIGPLEFIVPPPKTIGPRRGVGERIRQ